MLKIMECTKGLLTTEFLLQTLQLQLIGMSKALIVKIAMDKTIFTQELGVECMIVANRFMEGTW